MMRELDTVSPVVWPAWCYSGEDLTSLHTVERLEKCDEITGGQPETEASGVASADVLQPRPPPHPPSASSMATTSSSSSPSMRPGAGFLGVGGASAHRKRRSVPRSYDTNTIVNGSGDGRRGTPPVKSERLSPAGLGGLGGLGGPGDNASTSSRSGTPSSPPASALPHPAASPAASPSRNNNNNSINNNNISSHLKAMEDTVTHNYSEFMRNLAAKYQYVHPDEFYSATRNGFPPGLDPRFPYKAGAAPFLMPPLGPGGVPVVSPLHHLAAPVTSAVTSKESSKREDSGANSNHSSNDNHPHAHHKSKSPPSSAASAASDSLLFSPLFAGGVASVAGVAGVPGVGAVPGMDMSSTQALVSMVQRSHQNQLETYLKGAIKRPAEASPLSPLDLSSGSAPPKKSKKASGLAGGLASSDVYGVDTLLGLPSSLLRSSKERLATRTPPSRALSSPRLAAPTPPGTAPGTAPGSPQSRTSNPLACSSLCSTTPGHASAEGPCAADAVPINHWSVGDVCNFVGSIDLCVEYVQTFRDQRIDGSALPLLTEEHLRSQMKMKLGPALKLRAVLAKRLGHCSVCLHCVHCHNVNNVQAQGPQSPASASSSSSASSGPGTAATQAGTSSATSPGTTSGTSPSAAVNTQPPTPSATTPTSSDGSASASRPSSAGN